MFLLVALGQNRTVRCPTGHSHRATQRRVNGQFAILSRALEIKTETELLWFVLQDAQLQATFPVALLR